MEEYPADLLTVLGLGVGYSPDVIKSAIADLKQDLEALTLLLADSPYLTGDEPTLADLAVAGLSMLLKFPDGPYLDLPASIRGKGVPILADNPDYELFFAWRDRLYAQFRKPLIVLPHHQVSAPTAIQID